MTAPQLPPGPSKVKAYLIRVDPKSRMLLQFHLEASDGIGYLESIQRDASLARLEFAPQTAARGIAWLNTWAEELGLEWLEPSDPL